MVSNREPYIHVQQRGKIAVNRGSGGVITALDPILQSCNGLWVAWGNGDGDKRASGPSGKVAVPPDNPSYTLKRVWLTKQEEIGYYYGFSNEAIWPLCHTAFTRPVFRKEDWESYLKVNEKFADAIAEELQGRKAFVWIQDYHLCMLPKFLKEKLPNQTITAHFWHIPWPSYETFRICPQKREILEGLLANDLLGFHIRYHCNNFLDTVDRELESKIDRERQSIIRGGHETLIRPFPISVDYTDIRQMVQKPVVEDMARQLTEEFGLSGKKVLLGLDRLDYTKGIPERLLAVDRLLELRPELAEKFVFLQMGEISRLHIPRYKQLNDEINMLVEQINWKHSTDTWKPIILIRRHLNYPEPLAFFKLGDVCIVSPLHDGMNLVAKEYVVSSEGGNGMLVLSQFAGASRELTEAVTINPYDREQFAEALYSALTMPEEERRKRMSRMSKTVEENNIYRWAGKMISELLKIEFAE
ncbi:MAG: trehalose-6-phosphate synthase [Elusimicrobia bacterium]|nr:trehalose-6-phosphate synthase [Elusimicrobiota bacterium]